MQTEHSPVSIEEARAHLSTVQSHALLDYGARLIVMRELCQVILTQLSRGSRTEMQQIFRSRIERVLAMTDDSPYPLAIQTAFLNETNYFLSTLETSVAK